MHEGTARELSILDKGRWVGSRMKHKVNQLEKGMFSNRHADVPRLIREESPG